MRKLKYIIFFKVYQKINYIIHHIQQFFEKRIGYCDKCDGAGFEVINMGVQDCEVCGGDGFSWSEGDYISRDLYYLPEVDDE